MNTNRNKSCSAVRFRVEDSLNRDASFEPQNPTRRTILIRADSWSSIAHSRLSPRWAQRLFQRGEAAVVLFRGADGDANAFRQLIASHRARDDAQLLHFLAHALTSADADEDEVRVGGNELQTELTKCVLQVIQAAGVVGPGAGEMCLVVQRGERAGLGDGVDVERLADLFQRGNQFRVSDAVTQPQSRQPEAF